MPARLPALERLCGGDKDPLGVWASGHEAARRLWAEGPGVSRPRDVWLGEGTARRAGGGPGRGFGAEPGSLGLSVHSRGRQGGLWGEAPAAASDLAQAALRKDAARRREEQEASRGPEATPPP